ncbi:MAG: M28 family peptidase [Pirellulales bacterium]|nr:M28 family peptidase [Pirellulales bacterium]
MKHRRTILFAAVAAAGLAAIAWAVFAKPGGNGAAAAAGPKLTLENIPFNGQRAYGYLKQLCEIGPRPSGSPGMAKQQKLLTEHFKQHGGQVELQRFRVRDPRDGQWVPMANVIVRWRPEAKDRILLCAHYDTLPFPMLDPEDPLGRFVGANDNASGVALLMELAHDFNKLDLKYGVDFVMLDGEEYIFRRGDRMFIGSEWFARQYAKQQLKYRYRWGVLLDMIGATDLRLPQERNSIWWRDTRPLVAQIWATAARLGVREFLHKKGDEIDDDHVILHAVGRIPCIDVIQPMSEYPPWHTRGDTPDKCSPLSLAKVGWVIREWLKTVK